VTERARKCYCITLAKAAEIVNIGVLSDSQEIP
jgi:hypothetical protein